MTPDILAFLEPDTLPETIVYHPMSGQPGFSPDADITYTIVSDPTPVPEPSTFFLFNSILGQTGLKFPNLKDRSMPQAESECNHPPMQVDLAA